MSALSKVWWFTCAVLAFTPVVATACYPDCGDCFYGYYCEWQVGDGCLSYHDCPGCKSCYSCYCEDDDFWCTYQWGPGFFCLDGNCHSPCERMNTDWSRWFNSLTFTLNPAGKGKVESAINYITHAGVHLNEITGESTAKQRDCCKNDGVESVVTNGERYSQNSVTASVEIAKITIWGLPTVSKHFDWGVIAVDVDFEASVGVDNISVSLSGTAGHRWNDCTGVDCDYGYASAGLSGALAAKLEVIACVYCLGHGACTYVQASATCSAGLSGNLGWNINTCSDGFTGCVTVNPGVFSAQFNVDGLGAKVWEIQIWDEATF